MLKTEKFGSGLILGNKAIVFCVGKQACVGSISGEVPGLYTPEELEPLLSPLKDAASQDGFTGPLYNYFSYSQSCILIGCALRAAYYFCLFSSLRYVCPLFVLSGKKSFFALIIVSTSLLLYNVLQQYCSVSEVEVTARESDQ